MDQDLGEIRPEEFRFIFKPNQQISCVVELINKSNRHIAFKFKTTHPKLYSVSPNEGIVEPCSTCAVKVTRRAQGVAPLSAVIAKEKFLIQRTFVREDTVIKDVASIFLPNDKGKHINQKRFTVVVGGIPKVKEKKSKTEEQDLKLKIKELDLRLKEAEKTISKLKEQQSDRDCKGKKTYPWKVKQV